MTDQTVESDAWAVIANLRDQHPRVPDDCPTEYLVEALAAAGLLAAPATLPHDAAGQIAATVHNALCMCQGHATGITLRSRDRDLIQAAVVSLLESWQGASPVPAGDAVERLAAALHETYISRPAHNVDDPGSIFWRDLARTALGAVPADDEATPTMRTLHVTATRDIPEGHTDQGVRYDYNGDSWEGWLIATGSSDAGKETYIMRDNGERWVVMTDNVTLIDSAAALAALREGEK